MQLHHTIQIVNHHSQLINIVPTPALLGCATALNRQDRIMSRATGHSILTAAPGLEL
jgi:hypothetical protein